MSEWKLVLALIAIALGLVILGAGFTVVLFSSTVEEGSIADKYIIPHTEEQVSIQEEEMECIGMYYPGGITISKLHDNRDNVTCWVYKGGQRGGISCIPDHMLTP